MIYPAYDIFKRDGFGARTWVEAACDLEAAKHRIMDLSVDSPGKYVVVSRASGQMVSGGTTITSGSNNGSEPQAQARQQQTANGTSPSRKVSSHAVPSPSDTESETLWR
jgi:hypothetical protein